MFWVIFIILKILSVYYFIPFLYIHKVQQTEHVELNWNVNLTSLNVIKYVK